MVGAQGVLSAQRLVEVGASGAKKLEIEERVQGAGPWEEIRGGTTGWSRGGVARRTRSTRTAP